MSKPNDHAGAPSGSDSPAAPPASGSGRFAYGGLERAIHEKARLGIMSSLVSHPKGLLFGDLKDLCALTDGNLSRHLQVLHDEGLVEVWKGYHLKRPQTLCRLTEEGRRRFLGYITELENVIADALSAARAEVVKSPIAVEGWSPA
ncbi:MAG: Bacterial regulatory protein arsR family [Planctomycetota bacterium]|nr:Bacterial regulatory protein arsR family [Planctomycetota bacterium]